MKTSPNPVLTRPRSKARLSGQAGGNPKKSVGEKVPPDRVSSAFSDGHEFVGEKSFSNAVRGAAKSSGRLSGAEVGHLKSDAAFAGPPWFSGEIPFDDSVPKRRRGPRAVFQSWNAALDNTRRRR
jgi:hypothetical protein